MAVGSPPRRPRARAAARPPRVRSRTSWRSTSASARTVERTSRPPAVVVSLDSVRGRRRAPVPSSSVIVASRCGSDRPRRSRRQTTRCPPPAAAARGAARARAVVAAAGGDVGPHLRAPGRGQSVGRRRQVLRHGRGTGRRRSRGRAPCRRAHGSGETPVPRQTPLPRRVVPPARLLLARSLERSSARSLETADTWSISSRPSASGRGFNAAAVPASPAGSPSRARPHGRVYWNAIDQAV